jgi:hypothetical protein
VNDDASRFGPRLYGLFDDLEDEPPAGDDQSEDVVANDAPTLEEIIERMRVNGLTDMEGVLSSGQDEAAPRAVALDAASCDRPSPRLMTSVSLSTRCPV